MNYLFVGLAGLGLVAVILLATCSCTRKGPAASSAPSNGSAKRPDETDPEKGVYVIGREMAKAAEAEQRWKQQGTRESPLPKQGYDSWHGDLSLIDPAPNSLDDALREITGRYATSDPQQRAALRDSIDMDGFYTLMTFGRRSAVFAMREKKVEIARHGLTAIAMIDQQRVDFRDILMCLSLLYHAANRVGADADKMFREAALLAEPEVGKQIVGFAEQTSDYRSLRRSWGYDEVETAKGVGFIGWEFAKYAPTVDLKSLAMDVADLVAADKYQPDGISVAAKLPPIWLSKGKNAELERVMAGIRGGASLHGSLRPNEHPKHAEQGFFVFIVETSQPDDAQTLLRLSQAQDVQGHCMIGAAASRLFALIVARSTMVGVEAYETRTTLARFEEGLAKILARYADKAP